MVRILATVALLLVGSSLIGAQDAHDIGAVKPGENAPQPAMSPEATRVSAAVEAARREVAELEARFAEEAAQMGGEVESLVTSNNDLSEKARELEKQLRKLDEELFKAEGEVYEAEQTVDKLSGQRDALLAEIRSQCVDLRDRFKRSILTIEDPTFMQKANELVDSNSEDILYLINDLLGLFEKAHSAAHTVSQFDANVRLTDNNGIVTEAEVVRLGYLGGYYSLEGGAGSGFLVTDPEFEELSGRTTGISDGERGAISGLVSDPAQGGLVPFDVTGGAGLASLQTKETLKGWVEKGGKFMWPLIIVAAIAALIVLERIVMLTIRSRGLRPVTNKVVKLVEEGRIEEAITYTDRVGGPLGKVLHSALVHHEGDRAVIEDAVQEALLHQTPVFQARLGFIALCAAIAPLMGLLGTVTGMILTFKMVTLFGTSDPRFMAGGISEALITTQGGLYLAIPCLLFRGILGSFAEASLGRLETGAMSVVLAILENRDEPEADEDAAGLFDPNSSDDDDQPSSDEEDVPELDPDVSGPSVTREEIEGTAGTIRVVERTASVPKDDNNGTF